MATKKQLYIIDPQDIFDPFFYVVSTSLPTADQKWAYEDIIAPGGLLEHNEAEYQVIRRRGLLPRFGSTTGDRDVDFGGQVASCRQAVRNMDLLVSLKVKGVYWGENEPSATSKDKQDARRYRDELTRKLLVAAKLAANYILDWERALAYLAAWKLNDPAKTLIYLRHCATKMLDQYENISAKEGKIPDGVGRLKWDHVNGMSDQEIVKWMIQTLVLEPKAAHGRDKSYPMTPDHIVSKVYALDTWVSLGSRLPIPSSKAPKNLDAALTAFDLAAPSKPLDAPFNGKKRAFNKKSKLRVTEVIDASKLDVSKDNEEVISFDQAVRTITDHYREMAKEAGIDSTLIPITAGPIYFTNGEFRYDTTFETRRGMPSTIPLDKLSVEQSDIFQRHLEAFDVAFAKYIDENSHAKAQANLAKGIWSFLMSKKKDA